MRPFVSLPNKILLLLIALTAALTIALSWSWISKINQDFVLRQQEIRQQNQKQYWLLNELLRTRLESWVELFIQLHQRESEEIQAMAATLSDKMDFLHLNWQVEHLWLADSDGNLVFSTRPDLPEYVSSMQRQALSEQRSIERIYCAQQCVQALSIPMLTSRGELAVISMSLSLLETLAFLNQSTEADLAQVFASQPISGAGARELTIRGPLSRKTQQLIQTLIDRIPERYGVNDMLVNGVQVSIDEQEYLLNLITMTTIANDGNYVLSVHDITPMMRTHREYQQTVLFTIGAVIFVAGVLIYLIINSLRRRLLRLSEQLPLLAQRDYQGFNALSIRKKRFIGDELDTLQDSAIELASRLEKLDTEVIVKTRELERIAMYDSLTELPNRNMLTYQLNLAIDALRRRSGIVVILFFDLDDFKKVNDSYGHGVGDALLCEASNRLKAVLRKSDIACRFGGDEFVVMLNHLDELEGAIRVADKILESFVEPIHIDNLRFYVSTSLGIAATDNADISADDLIRHADIAMYEAKTAGGNCCRLYDADMSRSAMEKVALESEARDALAHNQFSYALQPQVELDNGKLVGFEALIRWEHPERGMVPPGQFIPVLENTEFMLSLGYWCIEHAFDLLLEFKAKGYGELKIAINLSSVQFLDPGLIPFLKQQFIRTGLSASLIELELTERTLVSDVEKTTEIMEQLTELGCFISIDDFGTGYSSLSYLKKMPAHIIKIDRTFIDGMLRSNADKQIVKSTISMVQNLGMQIVAEGIEEQLQIDLLKLFECDMAQGYFISRPIAEKDVFDALDTQLQAGIWKYVN